LFGVFGKEVTLSESLGAGKEAHVYAVGSTTAAKVFQAERLAGNHTRLAVKVKALIAYRKKRQSKAVHQVLWPTSLLRSVDGRFAGYLMDRVSNASALHVVARSQELDPAGQFVARREVALQLVEIFEHMHALGLVIADVSSNNFLVGKSASGQRRVFLIDVDSVQMPGSPSETRTPRYIRPEELRGETNTGACVESDLHALGFLLFELFMRGNSPYAHVGGGSSEENTKKQFFPYRIGRASKRAPGRFAPFWMELPWIVRQSLVSHFSSKRLTAQEWKLALLSSEPGRFTRSYLSIKTHLKGIPTWKTN